MIIIYNRFKNKWRIVKKVQHLTGLLHLYLGNNVKIDVYSIKARDLKVGALTIKDNTVINGKIAIIDEFGYFNASIGSSCNIGNDLLISDLVTIGNHVTILDNVYITKEVKIHPRNIIKKSILKRKVIYAKSRKIKLSDRKPE